MISPSPLLEAFERRYDERAFTHRSYAEALARYAALWAYARALRPDVGAEWEADLAPDLAMARALNGLPPRP